tara:strand:- start:71 stop:1204 length:1134 start_codon:yes stop_codon:yes gene_type:complete
MKIINFFGALFLILLVSTNAYSKKPLKTDVVFESEYGGIYSIKLPMFSGKGRWQPSFDIINDLSQKNCNRYSKKSFLLLSKGSSAMTVRTNGKIKVNAVKSDQGLLMDYSVRMSVSHNYFRFFCGGNIEEILINFSTSNKFFSENVFKFSVIGTSPTGYLQFINKRYKFNKIQENTRENIALKLKELSEDRDYELKTNKQGIVTGNIAKANFSDVINNAKKLCKELGFSIESEKYSECIFEVMEINDAYNNVKDQENILISRTKEKENIQVEFNYEASSGEKINKDSKWNNFWKGVAWILNEHGEDIFNIIVDLKYGTNYSGYNSSNEVTNNRNTLRCTGQRVGNIIYENCRGGGVWIKCRTTVIGNIAKRRCRQVS